MEETENGKRAQNKKNYKFKWTFSFFLVSGIGVIKLKASAACAPDHIA